MGRPKKSGELVASPEKTIKTVRLRARPVLSFPPPGYQPGRITESAHPIRTSPLGIVAPIYEEPRAPKPRFR